MAIKDASLSEKIDQLIKIVNSIQNKIVILEEEN